MSTGLSFRGGYELELAIDSNSEIDAINRLSRIFGRDIANEINRTNISKHGDLFFIKYRFTNNQLSDDNYRKLDKDNKILVISDSLAIKRAAEILEYCFPVEVQLKKLLTYVYPSILEVFDGKTDKKSRIKLCKQINSWNLGDLLERLEFDISQKRREEFFIKDGRALASAIESSNSFDDFKDAIISQIRPNTVWDQICVVLEKPVDYVVLKDRLHSLRYLRNKAAHPQIILCSDIEAAKNNSKIIMGHIRNVKDDYNKELSKSIRSLEKVLSEVAIIHTSDIQKIMNEYIQAMPDMSESIKKIKDSMKTPNPAIALKNIDWLAIDSRLRNSDPEMKEIMERFDNNDAKTVIDEMKDELNGLQSNEQKEDNNKTR